VREAQKAKDQLYYQKRQLSGNSSLTLQTAAFRTGPAMYYSFTSEISVKREHGILIPVLRYFYFLMSVIRVRDSCVGRPPLLYLPPHNTCAVTAYLLQVLWVKEISDSTDYFNST